MRLSGKRMLKYKQGKEKETTISNGEVRPETKTNGMNTEKKY